MNDDDQSTELLLDDEIPFGIDENGIRVPPRATLDSVQEKWAHKGLTSDGSMEIPDPEPMAPPVGYVKQQSITERIRQMVHDSRVQAALEAQGEETFDEANDFNVEDELFPESVYELPDDVIPMYPASPPSRPQDPSEASREPAEQVAAEKPGSSPEASPSASPPSAQ